MNFFVRPIIRPPANLYKNDGVGGGGEGGSNIRVSRNGQLFCWMLYSQNAKDDDSSGLSNILWLASKKFKQKISYLQN